MRRLDLNRGLSLGAMVLSVSTIAVASDPVQEPTPLQGRVSLPGGEVLSGIPVRAHRVTSNVSVVVYTDQTGSYSFPAWSDLTPATYDVSVTLPDFEYNEQPAIVISEGRTTNLDFTLRAKPLAYEDATTSEIIAALPGTDHEKVLFAQCGNCHSLQHALRVPRTKEGWRDIIVRMGGASSVETDAPGTYAFNQREMIEPLADYLARIRGPGSSASIPFTPRPRPTGPASTNLVITEYDLPRGGEHDLYLIRGDRRFVWPHDVVLDDKYAYYTDHFSYVLGRMDRATGRVEELPFELPVGAGRAASTEQRAGNPGGGAHDLLLDKRGNLFIGMARGTVRFDTRAGTFHGWPAGAVMFGLDPDGNVWFTENAGPLVKIDTRSDELSQTVYPIRANAGIYDMDTDSKGRTMLNIWREGMIGIFDPRTQQYADYPTPTPRAGPRRGEIDAQDRLWVAEFFAGNLAMFDPEAQIIREYPLYAGSGSYRPPYAEPYSVSVDNKNQLVWTNDFSNGRLFRFDMRTGAMVEYLMPRNYELRDLTVDQKAPRPTVWLPSYRAPAQLVKVQLR